jgi:hypothetical protein
MEKIKYFLFILLLKIPLLLVVSLFCAVFYYFYQMYDLVPRDNVKESIGTVLGFQKTRKGELAKVHFKHEEQVYSVLISDVYVLGEKFMVEYEQDNPKANYVRLDKPVFLKGEDTSLTVGYLNTYNTNCFESLSYYTYYVDGNKYEKFFTPLENSDLKYPNAKEGYNYMVKYWNINPQRSIIVLDKKTDKSLYDIK